MRLAILTFIFLVLPACESIQEKAEPRLLPSMLDTQLQQGMPEEHVAASIGAPNKVYKGQRTKLLEYFVSDSNGGLLPYVVAIRAQKVLGWGPENEILTSLKEEYLTLPPHELCKQNFEWERHGSMKECKKAKLREQEELRAELKQEKLNDERRRQDAARFIMQSIVNRPAPVFQFNQIQQPPPVISGPANVPQPIRCTTQNVLGTLNTTCR